MMKILCANPATKVTIVNSFFLCLRVLVAEFFLFLYGIK